MHDTLGRRIKQARLARGLSQEQLAAPVLTKTFISKVEHDLSSVSMATLGHFAERLQQPLSYFVVGDPQAPLAAATLEALLACAEKALANHRYEEALTAGMDASLIASARGEPRRHIDALVGCGEALVHLRRFADADRLLREVLAATRRTTYLYAECRALAALGLLAQRSARYPEAASLYTDALTLVADLTPPDRTLHGDVALRRGMVRLRMGQLDDACEDFQYGERVFQAAGLDARLGEVLVDYGLALHLKGDAEAALDTLQRAVNLLQQYEDLEVLSWARNNLGMVLLEIGRPKDALVHLMASLAVKRRLGDRARECHTLTEIARCHLACGDEVEARRYAEKAVALAGHGFANDEAPRAQIVLAALAVIERNLPKAKRYLRAAAAYCEKASMPLELLTIYRELARVASLEGRFKQAHAYGVRAFAIMGAMRPYDVATAVRMGSVVAGAYDRAKRADDQIDDRGIQAIPRRPC